MDTIIYQYVHTDQSITRAIYRLNLGDIDEDVKLTVSNSEQGSLMMMWECQKAQLTTYQKWKQEISGKQTQEPQRPILEVCGN